MKTIACICRKGGVGKTTIAVGIAHALASKIRVAVVDLDPQSNVAAVLGGNAVAPGTVDLLLRKPVVPQVLHEIAVYAGGPDIEQPTITRLDPTDLRQRLSGLPYDMVLIDANPGIMHLERLAIRAADIALVPWDAHPIAAIGAERILSDIDEDRKEGRAVPTVVASVLTRFDGRRQLDKAAHGWLHRWNIPRFTVRYDTSLAQAMAAGERPAMSRAMEDLKKIAEWALTAGQRGTP